MKIETARGQVESEDLGVTLAHEHFAVLTDGLSLAFPQTFARVAAVVRAVRLAHDAYEIGIRSMVDLTVLGLGRDIHFIRDIAAQIPVNVIVATGLYTFVDVPAYFRSRSIDDMSALFIADIENGISGTDTKAGILKCATDEPGVTPGVDMVLRACARAHKATGAPISTHTHADTERGLDQIAIFEDEGVDLSAVVIGHCGDSHDVDYLERVAAKGVTMGMDRFSIDGRSPLDQRVRMVVEMWKRGYGDHMVLSHDCVCTIDWFPSVPERDFGYIHREVLPRLSDAGMSDSDIDQMLVHTPRRILEGSRVRVA
jgi:phosphotriesterase-related protein